MPLTCICSQTIGDRWHFCPACGRYAAQLEHEQTALTFEVASARPVEKAVGLVNSGNRAIAYRARIEPSHQIELTSPAAGDLRPGQHSLTVQINAVPAAGTPVLLHLTTWDGPRSDSDPWADPQPREHPPVPIRVATVAAPRLRVVPELLVLTDERPTRELKLTNEGRTELRVSLPALPKGMRYVDDAHQEGVTLTLAPGAEQTLRLSLAGHSRDTQARLTFVTDAAQSVSVNVVRHTRPTAEVMPTYVVGIDFGTRNSSVYVRRVGTGTLPDEIRAATPGGEQVARFPSAIYKSEDGRWHFGQEAVDLADREGRPVIRNIKKFIYDQKEPYPERGPEFTRLALLTRFLGYIRGRTKDFVRCQWDDDLDELEVIYVCSIPLLDPARQEIIRDELGRAMRQAVLAAHRRDEPLENWVRFAPEPLCAALYIILEREAVPIEDGDRIAVFDSGGGTTDVVVGVVGVARGRISFKLEDQIGLDQADNTFGGNDVTRRLLDPVLVDRLSLYERWSKLPGAEATDEVAWRDLLHEQMDRAKIAAVRGERDGADLFPVIPLEEAWEGSAREEQFVTDLDVTMAVAKLLQPSLRPIRDRFFSAGPDGEAGLNPGDIKYIFPVGGNTLLPRLRQGLRVLFEAQEGIAQDRLVLLEEDDVMEAVARGAVHVPDANLRNTSGYGLSLHRSGPESKEILWRAPANAAIRYERRRVQRAFQHEPMRVQLIGHHGEIEGVVAAAEIPPPDNGPGICHLFFEVAPEASGAKISVGFCIDPAGAPSPEHRLLEYLV